MDLISILSKIKSFTFNVDKKDIYKLIKLINKIIKNVYK